MQGPEGKEKKRMHHGSSSSQDMPLPSAQIKPNRENWLTHTPTTELPGNCLKCAKVPYLNRKKVLNFFQDAIKII